MAAPERLTEVVSAFAREFTGRSIDLLRDLDIDAIVRVARVLYEAKESDRRIFFFGNGGSFSLASHLAADFGKGTKRSGKKRYKALSLDNTAWLTAQANDGPGPFLTGDHPGTYQHGYDGVFVGQLENFLEDGDVLFAISASGNSPNVVNALLYGKAHGARTVGLLGFDGGEAARLADHVILVPTSKGEYGLVEGVHSVIHHLLYEAAKRLEES